VPNHVIQQAKAKLHQLESDSVHQVLEATPPPPVQSDLFTAPTHAVVERLKEIDPNDLTPRQALELLYSMKEQL
jgi:DNA mismatch repair protein MutS